MRIAYEMEYHKADTEHSTVSLVQYSPQYKNKYKKVYLLLEEDEIIGSVALKGTEIDDLLDYYNASFCLQIQVNTICYGA